MNKDQFLAEVIEGTLSEWTGQCWNWNHVPRFGSLITIPQQDMILFGIVHSIKTGSSDPIRTPMPYQKTEEELLRDQPQIFEFLQTTFNCIMVGYKHNNRMFYHLPGHPPKIHAFIGLASNEQYEQFFASDQFLHMLFNLASQISNFDELLIAIIKIISEKKCLNKNRLTDFIETFSMLSKNDYQRLKVFLSRLQQIDLD